MDQGPLGGVIGLFTLTKVHVILCVGLIDACLQVVFGSRCDGIRSVSCLVSDRSDDLTDGMGARTYVGGRNAQYAEAGCMILIRCQKLRCISASGMSR